MRYYFILCITIFLFACNNNSNPEEKATADSAANAQQTVVNNLDSLPAPYSTKSVKNMADVIGWKNSKPMAPDGFTVSIFADSLQGPRGMYVADNGDVFVAQADREGKKGNSIVLFRDKNKDGIPESKSVYVENLNQPFGMLIINNKFYVANTDGLLEFPYDPLATSLKGPSKQIVMLPGKGRHWTRNIVTNAQKNKIFIAVGSSSNAAEDGFDREVRRANILCVDIDGKNEKVYASGLRNPVGMDWAPGSGVLWTAVNERDELGDDVPPDYLVGVTENGFYGWPYSYFGKNLDPRIKESEQKPDLVKSALMPDVALGSHTASLGLKFYTGDNFPAKYQNGAFVAQHGSWNRSHLAGYKVVFVPFGNGRPSGKPEDFLTGFIANDEKSEVYGRPVFLAIAADGSLLVSDDGANRIWKVSYKK